MTPLHLEILPAAQKDLWNDLRQVPAQFVLYGGTAVALQLGHRQSLDFDFFCSCPFNGPQLQDSVPFLHDAVTVNQAPNTLICRVNRGGPVMVSFMAAPTLRQVHSPTNAPDNGCRLASLLDLAGTKASVVRQRAEAKDYIDIDALLQSGLSLSTILAAARLIFGERYDGQSTLKALSYFGDGDLQTLGLEIRRRLSDAVKGVDLDRLPLLSQHTTEIGA